MDRKIAFRFEKLEVWQMARDQNLRVYQAAKRFPGEQLFGLTSQLRRASVSVSSNTAEGSGRNSNAAFAHFLKIACASLMKVVSPLYLALDEPYLDPGEFDTIADASQNPCGETYALIQKLRPRLPPPASRLPCPLLPNNCGKPARYHSSSARPAGWESMTWTPPCKWPEPEGAAITTLRIPNPSWTRAGIDFPMTN